MLPDLDLDTSDDLVLRQPDPSPSRLLDLSSLTFPVLLSFSTKLSYKELLLTPRSFTLLPASLLSISSFTFSWSSPPLFFLCLLDPPSLSSLILELGAQVVAMILPFVVVKRYFGETLQEWESQLKQLWSKGIAYLLEQDKIQTCLDIRIVLTPNEGDIYLVQKNEHRILTATKVKTDTQRMLMDLVSSLTDDEKREQQQRRGNLQSHHRASYFMALLIGFTESFAYIGLYYFCC